LTTKLDRHGGEIVLRSETPGSEWYLQGVLLGLAKRGFPARARGTGGGLYPEDLSATRRPDQAHLQVVAGPDLARLTPGQVDRIVAYGGPLPLAKELVAVRASDARARRLFHALDAHEITGGQFLAKYNRLNKELGDGVVLLREDDGSRRSSR
jgi:hypothetical protein